MKLLVISHILPGDAEPGGARVGWLARGLAPFGVETHVLAIRREGTRRAEGAPQPDPGAVTVVAVPPRESPGQLASLFWRDGGFARLVVDHPSQAEAVRRGLEVVKRFGPDLVLSSIPPMRVGEVAYRIALETGLPWVIDWRDPVARRPLNTWPSKAYYAAYAEREAVWCRAASLHVATAPSYERVLAERYPGVRTAMIPNGWTDVAGVGSSATRGVLLYAGSLTPESHGFAARFPWKLSMRLRSRLTFGRLCHAPFATEVDYRPWGFAALEAISRCRDEVAAVDVRGGRRAGSAMAHVRRLGLGRLVRVLPWAHPTAMASEFARAHVLWLCCAGTSARGGEPVLVSKAAYYLASGRPVWAVVPPDSDTAGLLRGHAGVFMADPGDPRALAESLREALATPPGTCFDRDVDHLRRDRLAGELAERLFDIATDAGTMGVE